MNVEEDVRHWWRTALIDMAPGKIAIRGYPIEKLIGEVSLVEILWLMLRGQLPTQPQAKLLESAMVAGVDHGPQAPSIATARMAATCGVGLNNVIATGINILGDVHGGAGEQAAVIFYRVAELLQQGRDLDAAVSSVLDWWRQNNGKIIPGYGHRFHRDHDPRAIRLFDLVSQAKEQQVVEGNFIPIALAIEQQIATKDKKIPINIDGATAVIFCELGFPAPLARGLFCLSRSLGILAHGWEQRQQGGRNKGPVPPQYLPEYIG